MAKIISTLRGSQRYINAATWQTLSGCDFMLSYSEHVLSDLIKKLLMVTETMFMSTLASLMGVTPPHSACPAYRNGLVLSSGTQIFFFFLF